MAVFGFIGSVAIIALWGHLIGATWWWSLALMGVFTLMQIAVMRVVSEAGIFAVWTTGDHLEGIMARVVGVPAIGPRALTALNYMGWKIRTSACMTSVNILQGYKLADLARVQVRTLWPFMAIVFVVALLATHVPSLYAIYSHSIPALGWWPRGAGRELGAAIAWLLELNPVFTLGQYGQMAFGAGMVLFLNAMRMRYLWWPFHPLAYTAMMGPRFMGDRYGFSIFLGWLGRRLAQHFGGYRAYRAGRAAAVGLIVGNAVVLLFWTIVHYFRPIDGVLIIE